MTRIAGSYYRDVTGEAAMTVLLVQGWITAFSSGLLTAITVAGTGWDDDLESSSLSGWLGITEEERHEPPVA